VFVNPGRGEEGNQKEKVRVFIGNFELTPKGDQSGHGLSFI